MTERPGHAALIAGLTEERKGLFLARERCPAVALLLQDAREVAQAPRAHQAVAGSAEEADTFLEKPARLVQVALPLLVHGHAVQRGRHALGVAVLARDLERLVEQRQRVLVALRRRKYGRGEDGLRAG